MKGDPRCPPGVNLLDWVMNVLPPNELIPNNIEDIIEYERGIRMKYQVDGVKPKKHVQGAKIDLTKLGLASRPAAPTKRRRL